MKNLMIIIPIVLSFCIVGNGQVKEQFRDRENKSTIVVIKEDGAIDQALLDEHFDLADMNMSDQIMITTKPSDTVREVEVETATVDEVETYFENIELEEVDIDIEKEIVIEEEVDITPSIAEANIESKTTKNDKIKASPIVNSSIKKSPSRAKKSYAKKSSYKVKKAAKKKYYSKKKRKKSKRKKRFFNKRRSNDCYSF